MPNSAAEVDGPRVTIFRKPVFGRLLSATILGPFNLNANGVSAHAVGVEVKHLTHGLAKSRLSQPLRDCSSAFRSSSVMSRRNRGPLPFGELPVVLDAVEISAC